MHLKTVLKDCIVCCTWNNNIKMKCIIREPFLGMFLVRFVVLHQTEIENSEYEEACSLQMHRHYRQNHSQFVDGEEGCRDDLQKHTWQLHASLTWPGGRVEVSEGGREKGSEGEREGRRVGGRQRGRERGRKGGGKAERAKKRYILCSHHSPPSKVDCT